MPRQLFADLTVPAVGLDDLLEFSTLAGESRITLGVGYDVGLTEQLFDLAIASRKRLELVSREHG